MESLRYAQININKIVKAIDKFSLPLKSITEANTCDRFVLPFLDAFGWNPSYEYWSSQHRIGRSKMHADYAFSKTGYGWVFVEAKRIGVKNLDKNKQCQMQITKYFNSCPGAHLIILTNGEEYCFYSYGKEMEIQPKPFIKFNIRKLDLTGNGTFLRHLFINKFNIGNWPKYAEISRSLSDIQYALRKAPDTLGKQNLINKSFELIYPELDEDERNEAIRFFSTYK